MKEREAIAPSFIVNTSLTRRPIRLRAFKLSSDALWDTANTGAREHSRKADWMCGKFMTLTRRKRHNRFPAELLSRVVAL